MSERKLLCMRRTGVKLEFIPRQAYVNPGVSWQDIETSQRHHTITPSYHHNITPPLYKSGLDCETIPMLILSSLYQNDFEIN